MPRLRHFVTPLLIVATSLVPCLSNADYYTFNGKTLTFVQGGDPSKVKASAWGYYLIKRGAAKILPKAWGLIRERTLARAQKRLRDELAFEKRFDTWIHAASPEVMTYKNSLGPIAFIDAVGSGRPGGQAGAWGADGFIGKAWEEWGPMLVPIPPGETLRPLDEVMDDFSLIFSDAPGVGSLAMDATKSQLVGYFHAMRMALARLARLRRIAGDALAVNSREINGLIGSLAESRQSFDNYRRLAARAWRNAENEAKRASPTLEELEETKREWQRILQANIGKVIRSTNAGVPINVFDSFRIFPDRIEVNYRQYDLIGGSLPPYNVSIPLKNSEYSWSEDQEESGKKIQRVYVYKAKDGLPIDRNYPIACLEIQSGSRDAQAMADSLSGYQKLVEETDGTETEISESVFTPEIDRAIKSVLSRTETPEFAKAVAAATTVRPARKASAGPLVVKSPLMVVKNASRVKSFPPQKAVDRPADKSGKERDPRSAPSNPKGSPTANNSDAASDAEPRFRIADGKVYTFNPADMYQQTLGGETWTYRGGEGKHFNDAVKYFGFRFGGHSQNGDEFYLINLMPESWGGPPAAFGGREMLWIEAPEPFRKIEITLACEPGLERKVRIEALVVAQGAPVWTPVTFDDWDGTLSSSQSRQISVSWTDRECLGVRVLTDQNGDSPILGFSSLTVHF